MQLVTIQRKEELVVCIGMLLDCRYRRNYPDQFEKIIGDFRNPYVTDMIIFPSSDRKVHNKRRISTLELFHLPLANGGPPSIRLRRRSVYSHFLWYVPY